MQDKLDYTNLFSLNDYKNNDKIIYKHFNNKYGKSQVSIKKKIDETKNYLLDEIKHNDLMSQKYKKTCKYLNYVEHLLILVSTGTGSISISTFASLVCVPVGITSSAVGLKTCVIFQESKSISQLSIKRRRSMIK